MRPGRPAGLQPSAIVLHRTGASEALRVRFNHPAASVSAHYVVGRDGSIDQYVDELDTAFHAGLVVNSPWRLLRRNVNPNFYTIGIELAGGEQDDWPDVQVSSAAALVAAVAGRWGIPLDADHIIPHRLIRGSSSCPAPDCPIDRLIAAARTPLDRSTAIEESEPVHTTDAMDLSHDVAPGPLAPVDDIPIDRTTFRLAAKEFFPDNTRKDLVVLHFTAGQSARSAFDTWRRDPAHVATSYVVDVDGTIYEVFPPSAWAAHLGVKGTNYRHDRRSIGIEIANVGPLQRDADDPAVLNWWPRKSRDHPEFTTGFCRVDDTDRYVATDYRGKRHFAAFPDAQVAAVASLVRHICEQFSIPMELPPVRKRFDCDLSGFAGYKGICTHANFRADKWDIGPAFPWERLGL